MKPSLRSPSMRRSTATLLVVLAQLGAGPAWAQAASTDPTSSQTLYRRAYDAMDRKDWNHARRLLLELWARAKTHDVAASLGQVEYRLENPAAAARYLALAVALVPPQEKAETRERYEAVLAEMKRRVATVRVALKPAKAELTVDGEPVELWDQAPVLFLAPGTHTLRATAQGRAPVEQTVEAVAGTEQSIALQLTTPGVASGLDDSPPTPAATSASGSPPADSGTSDDTRTALLVTGGAMTAAASVATIVFALQGSSRSREADRLRAEARSELGESPCASPAGQASALCTDLNDALDRRATSHRFANVSLFITGAAALSTAAVYFLWPRDSKEQAASLNIAPVLGQGTGGVSFTGSF